MQFTPEQRAAIEDEGHLVVVAGAGSGKTRILVERYLRLVAAADAPDEDPFAALLAVTFTEKAAREMRERVRRTVEQRARTAPPVERARWAAYRAAVEGARIGTIHSFCAELLRAHPAETGLDPRFAVLDEVEASMLRSASVDAALRDAVSSAWPAGGEPAGMPGLGLLLETFGPAELRAMLIGLLQGGGETRAALAALPAIPAAVVEHWQQQLAQARAEACRELLASEPWRAATATLLALAPLAPAADRIGAQVCAVADWLARLEPASADFAFLGALNLQGGSTKLWGDAEALKAARTALRTLRAAYESVAEVLAYTPDPQIEAHAAAASLALRDLAQCADAHYSRCKLERDRLDFDDLERHARALLETYPHVRARWQAELRAVLVDEFQDTNDDQRAIIYALVGAPAPQRGGPRLFVVGDGKQSIYRFRGADVSVFRAVEAEVQAWGGRRVSLRTSFRAHRALLELINTVGARLFSRSAPLRPFEVPYEPLEPHRPAPVQPIAAELHVVRRAGDAAARRAAEAALLARRIAELVAGAAGAIVYDQATARWRTPGYGDVALLFQAASAFEPFEAALRAHGIPYLTTAGRGYYGRNEVQDLIHLLHALDDPGDELALVGALRSPLFALDDGTIMALRLTGTAGLWQALSAAAEQNGASAELAFAARTLHELYALRGRVTVVELLRTALERTGYLATISALEDGERRRVNVEKLLAAARLSGTGGLRAFSEYLEHLLAAEVREAEAPLEARGVVRLMTVHRSKGLEFPIVALPDLGRAPVPLRERWLARRAYGLALRVRDPDDADRLPCAVVLARRVERQLERAERERLLYVAMTRAQDYLLLSGPALSASNESWIGSLAVALGHPWESGGPPPGLLSGLQVFRHDLKPA